MPVKKNKASEFFIGISLRRRIIIGTSVAVLVPFIIMAMFLYIRLSNDLAKQAKEKAVLIAKDLSLLLESSLTMELKVVSAIAAKTDIANELYKREYSKTRENLISVFNEIGNNYISIFVTDTNGVIVVDYPEGARIGLNLSDREYFINASRGRPSISGPVFSRGPSSSKWTNAPILITAAPVKHKGKFIGMIAITHDVSAINDIMSGTRLGKTGYPFVTDTKGLVLIHPNQDYVMNVNMYEEPGMDWMEKRIAQDHSGAEDYNFRGTEKIAGFAHLNRIGWNVFFTQSRNEIMKPIRDLLTSITLIGLVFVIFVFVLIIMLSQKISSPVQKFVDILRQFTIFTNEFVVGIGTDRKIIFANPAAVQLSGKSADELIGSDPVLVNTRGTSIKSIWEKLESGVPWSGRITPNPEADTGAIVAIMIIPVMDNKDNISGYLEFGRDISNELMQEKRIHQTQKIEAIGTLAGGIAHDFNNILTGVFGYIELALLSRGNPPETDQYLRELKQAAERAADLVKQILAFSRQSTPELHAVVPKMIINEVIKLIRASTPSEIIIEKNLESDTAITADPIQIHQVIVNLCTNAVHAIGNNHGTIKIEIEDIIVDQEFVENHPGLEAGAHVLIRVSDTGCGIKPDVLDHIFDPFFTTKKDGEGSGLGLSVAHGIIRSMNGTITVYSEPGTGSMFNIFLPATENIESDKTVSDSSVLSGHERIMLIDDEHRITESISLILANFGYKVTVFNDSTKALDELLAHHERYDIVITDHSMVKLTGIDLAAHLKKLKLSKPVLLMSGFISQQMEARAKLAGIDIIIKKPLNMIKLTESIRTALDKQN
ncbi:MAG: response regulator [Spirochaetes bacterium]|nr:response regulator [Spirochaetota bacterium]MBN2769509.1 response regulator [Spirochaetota bacterium]